MKPSITERPILFTGSMVRATLDCRKTVTRHIIKHQPPDDVAPISVSRYHPTIIDRLGDQPPGLEIFVATSDDGEWGCKSPFGEPGDRLWVRETHGVNRLGVERFPDGRECNYAGIAYRADDGRHEADITVHLNDTLGKKESYG
ncbi:hypothetical protein BLA14095_00488 [Burkholderia lata]|uniref:hypothetical protein n=1 Tax=Burkholderia lata (strain ATCC 17760 / DSM 23089 / LMG 22485 / NCIMB 9086 / R18194 / 383) TaxID=482957 RepID=UPI00145459C6|nr:hypothetical protein [Burkholderia lata]VWB16646.1 hypothetical protein BLA14095_00488 [Burkholderia lata]